MLSIHTLASGSHGNCYLVSDGKSTLMLECGLSLNEIKRGTGYNLAGISACLVTHEHQDHAKAVPHLLKSGIPCYMSQGTAEQLNLQRQFFRLSAGTSVEIASFKIAPFTTRHDAAEPLGFLLYSTHTAERLLFVTDSFYIAHRFPPLDYVMVECNHITEYLKANQNPQQVARIFQSHMSLNTCIRFLQAQDLSRAKAIYLLHISKENGDPEQMQRAVRRATGRPVYIA